MRTGGRVPRRVAVSLAVTAVAGLGLIGCGQGTVHLAAVQLPPFAIVPAARVAAAPPGSPQRTILTWWRYMQYRSARNALKLFTPAIRDTLGASPAYAVQVYTYFGPWLAHVNPTITSVERRASDATVYIRAQVAQATGQAESQTGDIYVGIALLRVDGHWRIADDSFFEGQSALAAQASTPGAGRTTTQQSTTT